MNKERLGNIADLVNKGVMKYPGFKKYIDTGGIQENSISSYVLVSYSNKPSRANQIIPNECVAFARMKNTSKVFVSNKEIEKNCIISTGFAVLKPKSNISPYYLAHYLKTENFNREKDKLCTGATQKAIRNNEILNIRIPLYSLKEQEKIVNICNRIESIRQKRKASLKLLGGYLHSIFLEMFGNPAENEKKWMVKHLGDIYDEFKYGTNTKSTSKITNNCIPVLRIPNILADTINYEGLKYSVLPEKEYVQLKLIKDDLLFVRSNGNPKYIGRCAVFKGKFDCVYASYLIRARMLNDKNASSDYIQFLLSYPTYRPIILKKATTTAGNYNINTEKLKSLLIPFPPVPLQFQFAKIIEKVELLKSKIQESLIEIDYLFNSLLDKYFGNDRR